MANNIIDSLFQRSLTDLIKSIRLSPPDSKTTIINKSIDEIRREIKSSDPHTKSTALDKLTYLHSLHAVDISFSYFHSVELSSSVSHHHKRIAFLSAALSFDPDTTDVILLLTHQLRKDLNALNEHDVSLALNTLACICNADLARDLTNEVFNLINSNKVFVRKKAICCLLRVFELNPDAVRVCFKRVVENLENVDVGVLSAVVGLFCELVGKDGRSYLPLAPEFYKILVDCRNNWVLIKVLKIFGKLAVLEPRLGKRVVEPICEHMERTGAKSLVFECVRTILGSLSEYEWAVKRAVGKVREFLLEEDPNVRYLGLQALGIVGEKDLWAVLENKELVVRALSDADVNIRVEALRLVMSMVCEDNVMELCRILIGHALKSDPEFCNEILGVVLLTCSRNYYELVVDFDWYVSFLGEMARVPHCRKGDEIEYQLIDVGMRVKDARNELVRVARDLVIDPALLGNPFIHGVLAASAFISGEYVELSRNPFEIMEALLQPRTSLLSPSVRAIYIQSAFKVMTLCIYSYLKLNGGKKDYDENLVNQFSDTELDNENEITTHMQMPPASLRAPKLTQESITGLMNLLEINLGPLAGSEEVEVQERASNVLGLIKLMKPKILGCLDQTEEEEEEEEKEEEDKTKEEANASEIVKLVFDAFSEELGPVSLNSQERVPLPDGFVMKENLSELDAICGDIKLQLPTSFCLVKPQMTEKPSTSVMESGDKEESGPSSESTSLLAQHRKRHGIYYLSSESSKEIISNDYPPAHDPTNRDINEAEDLLKLTEQSLAIKKKASQVKPRPVVVKLDDGQQFNVLPKKPDVKPDLISGAVHEVLLGTEASTSSSKSKSSSNKKKEKGEIIVNAAELKDNTGSERRNHHIRGKERKIRSSGKEKQGHDRKNKQKSDSGKHKSQHRADSDVAPPSSEIPDFLL